MKLALIPPISLLSWTKTTNYQLMLPQLLDNLKYRLHYQRLCKDPEQYVILDNGAAEGQMQSPWNLAQVAYAYQPNELVLPDILGDGPATVRYVGSFLKEFEGVPNVKLGLVAAGANRDAALITVMDVIERFADRIDVLYVPRMLVTAEEPHARIHLAADLHQIFGLPMHFLGTNPIWIREAQEAADTELVRGIDTSAPFNYAYWTHLLTSDMRCNRPIDYFDLEREKFNSTFVQANVNKLLEWTHANTDVHSR